MLSCQRVAEPAAEPAVIVVVLDGVRVEESFGASPSSATGAFPWQGWPRIWTELVPEGVLAEQAWNLGATTTSPAHCALTSGRRQALANYPVSEEPGVYRPELPSLMEALREGGAARDEVVVMGSSTLVKPVAHSLWPGSGYEAGADFVMVYDEGDEGAPADTDARVVDAVVARLERTSPRFLLANLHAADRAGHYGPSRAYGDAVLAQDAPVAELWAWLQASPDYAGNTWMFVVADHGRHAAADSDPPWRHHGDACSGCRQVPLLALGPGVRAGERVEMPVELVDLAPTIAALLGVELPYAEGRVASELFRELEGGSPAGVAAFAQDGGVRAEVAWLAGAERRTELVVGDEVLSDPDAIEVAAPAVAADGEQAFVCFRELLLSGEDLPWRPRCFSDAGDGFEELPAPAERVGPFWEPALAVDGDELLLAYGSNPTGAAGEGEDIGLTVLAWAEGTWRTRLWQGELTFPTEARLVEHEGGWLVAGAVGEDGEDARDSRRLALIGPELEVEVSLSELAGEREWRLERPALRSDGERLELAALAYERDAVVVVRASSEDGSTWREAARVASSVLPHVAPLWVGETLVFAVAGEDGPEVCALDEELDCVAVGGELLQIEADGEVVLGLVRDGAWEVSEIALGG